jgi:DNA-directed RNA polymerase specialized sigma24 family protein
MPGAQKSVGDGKSADPARQTNAMTRRRQIRAVEEEPMGSDQHNHERDTSQLISVFDFLQNTDWADYARRLVLYAGYRLSRHGTLAARYTNGAEDYTQEAIAAFISGDRRFVPAENVTLFSFLCGTVNSLISHDAEKATRRGTQVSLTSNVRGETAANEINEEQLPTGDNFEQQVMAREELERFKESLDRDLQEYVSLRAADEGGSAEEWAKILGTTVSDVRNMDRRLRRRRPQWNRL